jgi:hypothetical protein
MTGVTLMKERRGLVHMTTAVPVVVPVVELVEVPVVVVPVTTQVPPWMA